MIIEIRCRACPYILNRSIPFHLQVFDETFTEKIVHFLAIADDIIVPPVKDDIKFGPKCLIYLTGR